MSYFFNELKRQIRVPTSGSQERTVCTDCNNSRGCCLLTSMPFLCKVCLIISAYKFLSLDALCPILWLTEGTMLLKEQCLDYSPPPDLNSYQGACSALGWSPIHAVNTNTNINREWGDLPSSSPNSGAHFPVASSGWPGSLQRIRGSVRR